jgi:Mrp family chromosome partitioning ATPase
VKGLLAEFRQTFDYVIIDSPPVNAVTDPTILAAEVDATVLVAEEGRTTYAALAHAKGALDRVSANILGVVINKIRAQAGGYHYYEYGYQPSSNGAQTNAETTATEVVATGPSAWGPVPPQARPVPGEPSQSSTSRAESPEPSDMAGGSESHERLERT